MHYHSRLLNEFGKFRVLAALLNSPDFRPAQSAIRKFLYRASCLLTSYEAIYAAERQTVLLVREYLEQIEFGQDRSFAISSDALFPAYSSIPAAFSALVLMQNEMVQILGAVKGVHLGSLPSSLRNLIKRGPTAYGFDDATSERLLNYWNDGGKYIRDLRDVDNHFDMLIERTYFVLSEDPGQILIELPDNPDEKSRARYIYEGRHDACDVIIQGIERLDILCEDLLARDIEFRPNFAAELVMDHVGDLLPAQARTIGLLIEVQRTDIVDGERRVVLNTMEFRQEIPDEPGAGNVSVRRLRTDRERSADE